MLTPAKRSASTTTTTNHYPAAVEITVIERPSTRNTNDRALPSVVIRQNSNAKTGFIRKFLFFTENMILVFLFQERPTTVDKRPPSRAATPVTANGNDRPSRRSYRVTTSLNNSIDEESKSVSPTRGKTPLI
jgi:hypothetical protein